MESEPHTPGHSHLQSYTYRIDENFEIYYVSSNWDRFAIENDAPGTVAKNVLHQSLWKQVSGAQVRHLFELLIARVKENQQPIQIPIHCDGPKILREIKLEIHPLAEGNIEFRSRIVKVQFRQAVALLDCTKPQSDTLIRMCSFCKKIAVKGENWVWPEAAIKILDLFSQTHIPQISHGICPLCFDEISAKFDL